MAAAPSALSALLASSTTSTTPVALRVYRDLLRATRIAFNGDLNILQSARAQAAHEFRTAALLSHDSQEALQKLEHAAGVAQILRENVVQGRNVGGEKYQLKIHEHTQRHDNESAGRLKGTVKSFKEIKAAQF